MTLREGSPCIDAGINNVIYNDEDGTRNDIGAYGGSNIFVTSEKFDYGEIPENSIIGVYYQPYLTIFDKEFYVVNMSLNEVVLEMRSNQNYLFDSNSATINSNEYSKIRLSINPFEEGLLEDSVFIKIDKIEFKFPLRAKILKGTAIQGSFANKLILDEVQSPFLVTEHLYISDTLIVNPGVKVKFKNNVSLVSNGITIAKGEKNKPIVFTGESWNGIVGNMIVEFCEISGARWWGLMGSGNRGTIFNVSNSLIHDCGTGIDVRDKSTLSIIANNLIYNNDSGINLLEVDSVYILNNVLTKNSNGIVYSYYLDKPNYISGEFINNIIYKNTSNDINGDHQYAHYRNNLFTYGLPSGNIDLGGNLVGVPGFVDEATNDFHLSLESICINSGYNLIEESIRPKNDIDQNARIWNGFIDIGAYEYGSKPLSENILSTSWNLLSFNQELSNDSLQNVFEKVLDKTETIIGYSNGAKIYNPSLSSGYNSLHKIDVKSAYWIKMKEKSDFYIIGDKLSPQTPIELNSGWNLVSYLPEFSDSIRHALASLGGNLIVSMGFDGKGETFYPELSDDINSLKIMSEGNGYWIKIKEADTLIYPYSQLFNIDSSPTFFRKEIGLNTTENNIKPTIEWINIYTEYLEINGQPIKPGTIITAKDNQGNYCGEYFVQKEGMIGIMPIYRDDFTTVDIDEGAEPGEDITIFIDKFQLPEKIKWTTNGDLINLGDIVTNIEINQETLPQSYEISQNYPNPFNPSTTINYQIPKEGRVEIKIYNLLGQLVKTLIDSELKPGYYKTQWHGTNNFNQKVSSGVYIYRISSGEYNNSKKMIILK